ncbi:MAG: EAL domain-containing protein [Pyrinomonadaceae bacterium]
MRFRSLRGRIVVLFVLLLLIVQVAGFGIITRAIENYAASTIREELAVGERIFHRVLQQNARQLALATTVLADDYGFRQAITSANHDRLVLALDIHRERMAADVMMLISPKRIVLADSHRSSMTGKPFPFPALIEESKKQGSASMIVANGGRLYQLVLVPVTVPAAWVALGFAIDDRLAADLAKLASLQVSFLHDSAEGEGIVFASTLPAAHALELLEEIRAIPVSGKAQIISLDGEKYQTLISSLSSSSQPVVAVLQRSLEEALAPFDTLQANLLALTLIGLGVSIAGSILTARNVTRPVTELAKLAHEIEQGNYRQAADMNRDDEIGKLAAAFNHMCEGIADREKRISTLAYRDALTGLPNRTLFNDRLQQALGTTLRAGTPLAVLIMDLDHFKNVNDTLGHQIGDLLLQEVAVRLEARLGRQSDTFARLGGDEFAVLLPTEDAKGAQSVALKLLEALEAPIAVNGYAVDVRASIGIASYPEHGADSNTLLRRADVAMYTAKRGNSGFAIYDSRTDDHTAERLSLLSELRHAVEAGELVLYYQPQLDLKSGEVESVEALVRWQHPQRGFVLPDQFVPFAEQSGHIKIITRWVLAEAFQKCAECHDRGFPIRVAINVSARDLDGLELTKTCFELLQRYLVKPESIRLEITEGAIMNDPARALQTLESLHGMGFGLSIDDFGKGYSSLSYLKKLPVNELKIDKSFVMGMVRDKDDAMIVRSTIDLGHNMGLKVVAEGIENQEELRLLKQLGCDLVQGFLVSKPLAAQDLDKWLSEYRSGAVPKPLDFARSTQALQNPAIRLVKLGASSRVKT